MPTVCIFLGMPPSLLGSEGLGAKEATPQPRGVAQLGSVPPRCGGEVASRWPCVCSDRMALGKPQSSPAHPSSGPSRAFLFGVASFLKFPLGLALIICFLIALSRMELVRRARLHMPWEGTWCSSQPLDGSELG